MSATELSASSPKRATAVLSTLILVAAIANLPLSVANVALPDIGLDFDASQTQLNVMAVAYSLGLAGSVLWLGAVGDRYGRKQMLLVGVALSVPACLVAAWAPSIQILIIARIIGGVAAGMAYPTTLSLITALWRDDGRTRAIALWSATGGAISALGLPLAGIMLAHWWWGSVFLITMPLVVIAVPLVIWLLPSHVSETSDPVDMVGGLLSALLVGATILAINFAPVPDASTLVVAAAAIAVAALVGFVLRERRTQTPLFDLAIAGRRLFWVSAVAGIIVFGSLMAAMFIGQQFLQNILGYSTIAAGCSVLPAVAAMLICAPLSARLIVKRGSRFTLLVGYVAILAGFATMLLFWQRGATYVPIGIAYFFIGAGVGFAGTPASHSLTGSVPVTRAGMASGTADLQRDLGGAIMQSILGALLTAGYAAAAAKAISSHDSSTISTQVAGELTKSFSSAANVARQYPAYADQIIASAKSSFQQGQNWAYAAGMFAVALGALLVAFYYPNEQGELALLTSYAAKDASAA